jgi:hypothetical protein
MSRRVFVAVVGSLLCVAVISALPVLAGGQTNSSPTGSRGAAARTPDDHPDLQGFWTNDSYTPLERPPELAGKEFFTPEEAQAYFKQRQARLLGQPKDDIHYDDAIWQAETYVKEAHPRTSLVVEPRDGKLPALTAEARQREAMRAQARRAMGPADSAQNRSLAERCIAWGNVGPPMLPPTYNANFEIIQTSDYVLLRHEMMHDVRMVHLDGRLPPGPNIRYLAGFSRGRWEGNTLVVETTNFTSYTNFRGSPQTTRQDISASEALRVVERFTRTGPESIRYEFTVDDPQTWTMPWSGEMPLRRWEGPIYEYACHEGNYGLENILRAARVAESGEAR